MRIRSLAIAVVALALSLAVPPTASASGSSEKPAKSETDKTKQQATEKYNDGVAHMTHAMNIAKQGDSAFAYNYRATADAKTRKQYEKARDDFQGAVELDPEMKEAWNNLGYVQRKLGDFDKSLYAYEKALAIDKDFAQAREYLGETYLALGKLDLANEELDHLKKLESPYADTLAASIETYKLKELSAKMNEKKGK